MNEQQLLAELRDKKSRRAAFSVMVKQYSERLYWVARHIVGTHENADDVLQNTFLKVWNKLDEFRGDAKLSTWLYRVVVNESLDYMRKEKKYSFDTDIATVNMSDVFADKYFDGDETERMLREAIETLPDAQKAVFVLKYYEDKPYKEISEMLGTSEGGLKANYHYAVEKIKKFFALHH